MTHDYTRKGGIVHVEIMLPAHAPPEFADRSILWNSVEQIEKARDSQLAREIEAALPRELSRKQQLALVRAYVKDNFVDKGMCADLAIHDKGTGNPHVHIMLTVRPLKENGAWGAKCRKAYDLDENGQRIPDGKGAWKNHREDTTDWNDKGNVEIWRAAWAAYTNRALEAAGHPALVDHRSYERRGIDKIPSLHLGPAASQMEKRGIRTDKREVNLQIAADNKLLKEIKARITRLYNWSKAEAEKPEGQQPSMIDLWEAEKLARGGSKERAHDENGRFTSMVQNDPLRAKQLSTCERIAAQNGVGAATVKRAEKYAKGVDAAEDAVPGAREDILTGRIKATDAEITALAKTPKAEIPAALAELRKPKQERQPRKAETTSSKQTLSEISKSIQGHQRQLTAEERTSLKASIDNRYQERAVANGSLMMCEVQGAKEDFIRRWNTIFKEYPDVFEDSDCRKIIHDLTEDAVQYLLKIKEKTL